MKRVRNLIIIVVALVALIGVAVAVGGRKSAATEVKMTTVSYGTLTTKIPTSGTVILPGTQTIPTLVAGNLASLNVRAGDHVSAGTVLASIENPTLESSAAGSQADYNSAAANVDTARVDEQNARAQYQGTLETQSSNLAEAQRVYDADKALLAQKAIARTTVDADKAKLDQARVAYEQAQTQLRLGAVSGYGTSSVQAAQAAAEKARILNQEAQQQLGFTRIVAPFSGTIMSVASQPNDATRTLQVGDPVTAGQSLFTIASSEAYTVRAQVDEQDIINVHLGQRVNVTSQNFPGQTLAGHISEIAPLATKSTDATSTSRQVLTTITLDRSPSFLKDGMNVDVDILTLNLAHVLVVPAQAVFKDGGSSYVWLDNHGKAEKRKVITGKSNDTQITITSGLQPGDKIVGERNTGLAPNALITPAPAASPSPSPAS